VQYSEFMMRFLIGFLRDLFRFYIGCALTTPFILLIAFHKPWWGILLYTVGVLVGLAGMSWVHESHKQKKLYTTYGQQMATILDDTLRTPDDLENFIETLLQYIESLRQRKARPEPTWTAMALAKVDWDKEREVQQRLRSATEEFEEMLDEIASSMRRSPAEHWVRRLAVKKRLRVFRECLEKYALGDGRTSEEIHQFTMGLRNEWYNRLKTLSHKGQFSQ